MFIIQQKLHEKLNAEDSAHIQASFGFPTDSPDHTIEQLPLIKGQNSDPFKPPRHYEFAEFYRVMMVQPWLEGKLRITNTLYYCTLYR